MSTVDLTETTAATEPEGTLEALPRRVALTLPELQLLAERANGAPLPFEIAAPQESTSLDNRLGQSRLAAEDAAYLEAISSLHDPAETLTKRGLLSDDGPDDGIVGALGLLAAPTVALDLDVVVGSVQAKAWHRQRDNAIAALATSDGIVFELTWCDSAQWAAELTRVAVIPDDLDLEDSQVPDLVDLPYELLDACGEAIRAGRSDLIPIVIGTHTGRSTDASGAPVADLAVSTLVIALNTEAQGRLRALVADVSAEGAPLVGVVSWVLLADGWRSLRPHQDGDEHRVEVRRVDPTDLAPTLAPVLAEVSA